MAEGERKPITILVADDDEEDRILTEEALSGAHLVNDLRFVVDGEDLLDYLRHEGEYYARRAGSPERRESSFSTSTCRRWTAARRSRR